MDRLAELLIPRRPAGDETAEDRLLELYLGLEPADGPVSWPAAGEVARKAGVARSAVAAVLGKARDRWHKSRELNELRTELVSLLSSAGGVATADELAALLLAARGSVEDSELIAADWRALFSALPSNWKPRPATPRVLPRMRSSSPDPVALSPELAAHAVALGAIADRMALEDPLPSPGRVEEELNLVAPPDGNALPPGRTLRLAAAASKGASLSARAELYPKGMSPATALRLSLGSLAGPRLLSEEAVRERVRGRFPDAARCRRGRISTAFLTRWARSGLARRRSRRAWLCQPHCDPVRQGQPFRCVALWHVGRRALATPEVLDARSLEEKIVGAGRTGAFLALTVDPRRAPRAEAELLRRFAPRERVSLELLLLREMRAEAEARKVKWPVVLAADAEGHRREGFPQPSSPGHQSGRARARDVVGSRPTGAAGQPRAARAVRSDAHAVRSRASLRHQGRPSQPMAACAPAGWRHAADRRRVPAGHVRRQLGTADRPMACQCSPGRWRAKRCLTFHDY